MDSKNDGMKRANEMFKIFMEQQGMGSEMRNAARMMHELYTELRNAGFSESQAMSILLTTISGGLK